MDKLAQNLLRRVTIGDLLTRAAERQPDKIAVVAGERTLNFRAFNSRAVKAANAFLALGIGRRDHIAFLCRNSADYMAARFGLAKIGAVAVPLNILMKPHEVAAILADAAPKMVVCDSDLAPLAAGIRDDVIRLSCGGALDGWRRLESLIEAAGDTEPQVVVETDDLATLIYTTGTEAAAKGVMTTHLNHVMSLMHLMADCGLGRHEVLLIDLPLFHIAGTALMLGAILLGGTAVVLPAPDPTQILALTERHRVTLWSYPPTLFAGMLGHPALPQADLSSLKGCIVFGSTLPDAIRRAWDQRRPGLQWRNYWGQTESSPVGTTSWPERFDPNPGAIGRPDFGVSIRAVDAADGTLAPGEIGELVMRGPAVMRGYWNRPELTENALRGGWLHTGDLGFIDTAGEVHFVDRKKDMIKTGGENVSAAEVEAILTTHPAVAQAAVVGLSDPRWTEAVTACVMLAPGKAATPDELIVWCKERLAGFKVPKAIHIRTAFPLSPAGKIMKRLLKQELLADIAGERKEPA